MKNCVHLLIGLSVVFSCYAQPLSKPELLAIGERYIEAVESRSMPDMKSLFADPEKMEYWAGQLEIATERIWIKGTYPKDGVVWLQTEKKIISSRYGKSEPKILGGSQANRNSRGIDIYSRSYGHIWLMVTPDGKIKYDSLQHRHPLQIAELCIRFLDLVYKKHYNEHWKEGKGWSSRGHQWVEDLPQVYQQLKDLGVPLYGVDLSSSEREYEKAIRKTKKWLIKNGEGWDISKPEVYIPDDLYKQVKKDLLR